MEPSPRTEAGSQQPNAANAANAAQAAHRLRCRCGALQGLVARPRAASRVVCYCTDCQAFARFLGPAAAVLDERGGTEVAATLPGRVRFTQGQDRLCCMSLSPKGLLRWYAGCCRTPIGNTPRDPRLSYVGLVHSCLGDSSTEREAAFGPLRMAVNTAAATVPVAATPVATVLGVLRLAPSVLAARVGGGWRDNPFFHAGGSEPVVAPEVLTLAQRQALREKD
jgi:hypothetical protein